MTMTMADVTSAATAGQDGAVASGKGPRAGQPKRRTFSAAYKARIVAEYDPGQADHEGDRRQRQDHRGQRSHPSGLRGSIGGRSTVVLPLTSPPPSWQAGAYPG